LYRGSGARDKFFEWQRRILSKKDLSLLRDNPSERSNWKSQPFEKLGRNGPKLFRGVACPKSVHDTFFCSPGVHGTAKDHGRRDATLPNIYWNGFV
jgi:hypothetical protein